MIWLVGLAASFIISEVAVTRGWIPPYLKGVSTARTFWLAALSILVIVVAGGSLRVPAGGIVAGTIYFATVISNRYLTAFAAMERGKKG
ncbi:hypothetical protein [Lactiplantibacillus carotarum]|uniref:hypothetical protein n=1 Tax=Lactiplantibacillus carotarum TaxID=2993456 RepID=UPI00298F3D54|nr:hypothetical protein [Lactiplantibacillus carotarum]